MSQPNQIPEPKQEEPQQQEVLPPPPPPPLPPPPPAKPPEDEVKPPPPGAAVDELGTSSGDWREYELPVPPFVKGGKATVSIVHLALASSLITAAVAFREDSSIPSVAKVIIIDPSDSTWATDALAGTTIWAGVSAPGMGETGKQGVPLKEMEQSPLRGVALAARLIRGLAKSL